MSTMLALDEEFAETLRQALPGEVVQHELDLDGIPLRYLEDEGPRALAVDVARKAPDVLVTGVKLGGNAWCGMEGVRRVLKGHAPPAVVVLAPLLTPELTAHGRELGVYGFIWTKGRKVEELVAKVSQAVLAASYERRLTASHAAQASQAPGQQPLRPASAPRAGRRGPSRAGKK